MAFFKARVGDKVYELERLTLGESRVLKKEFGLTDLEFFSPSDPDQLVGLLALAIRRGDPSLTLEQATAEAEDIDIEQFEAMNPNEDEADPTSAATAATDGEDEGKSGGSGKSAKPRKKPGAQN